MKAKMIYQEQSVEGTQMVIWGDPKGAGEVFVVHSIKAALALWSLVSERPGLLVISAPDPDELALLFQNNPSNNGSEPTGASIYRGSYTRGNRSVARQIITAVITTLALFPGEM
jgi:hypothetical protein